MQRVETTSMAIAPAHIFAGVFLAACACAALIIGTFPLQLSILTIFLFAGPHNLMEFRYFAARMPMRWGSSRAYYSAGIGGVLVLTADYTGLYFTSGNWLWSRDNWAVLAAVWNTAFILWVGLMFHLRGKQRRGRDMDWAIPVVLFLAALAWLVPQYWSLSLVYLHPLVALWFLDRQMRRTRPEWVRAYRFCLASIPVFLVMLWATLYGRPNLSEDTSLFWRISQHAGSEILPFVSSHLLVAIHVFLETIHYSVWLVIIPVVDERAVPWRLRRIPLLAKSNGYPKLIGTILAIGAAGVVVLWAGFALDYTTTRDLYFAFAIGHVLAEFPFLIKML